MSETVLAEGQKKVFTARETAFIAVMSALMAVCSWISIPASVPFTLQTFAIFCALGLLGGRNGTFSVLVYILIGAVGIPVFSGFSGGISALTSYSGGYITGFIFLALVYWGAEKLFGDSIWVRVPAMIVGLAVCYAFGTAWFMHVTQTDLKYALTACVFPFIPIDLAKMVLAIVITDRVKKVVRF